MKTVGNNIPSEREVHRRLIFSCFFFFFSNMSGCVTFKKDPGWMCYTVLINTFLFVTLVLSRI